MITIKTIVAVHTVLETKGVALAAKKLGVAQSVISAHLGNFKQWFSYPIFKLGRRALSPTFEGELVLQCVREVLQNQVALSEFAWGRRAEPRSLRALAYESRSITLKQIEAFYWLVHLGSVVRAANKLNVTQSAASRRVLELGLRCSQELFLAGARKHELTTFGKEFLVLCENVLMAFEALKSRRINAQTTEMVLHVGITELVALTWFPRFVQYVKEVYPHVILHPDVDISTSLQEKLIAGELDIVVLPQPFLTEQMGAIEIGSTSFAWFCAPGAFGDRKRISLFALAAQPLLVQGKGSGLTLIVQKLFASAGLAPQQVFGSNSLVALAGLIESGIGVSCLPQSIFGDLVQQNRLQIIDSTTPPKMVYYMAFLTKRQSELYYAVADIAKETCRF